MKKYSHRERVLATLNHQKPDRVPIDLMGNASMLLDETYFNLRDHLNFPPIPPMRSGTTANYYDERILEYLDIDFRRIFLKKNSKNKIINDKDGSFTDEWGIEYRKTGQYVNAITHPLLNLKNKKEVENYSWPKAKDIFNTEGLAEEAKHLFNETDYALVARNPMPGGFLEHSCNLMSMESFFVSMMYEPEIIQCIINRLLKIYKDVYTMFLDAVGPFVQMVEVSDDLGSQDNLLISPQMFREFLKPAELELYNLIHEKAPNAALFHHTDGAIFDLIPDLIEVGVNVLNPVQTSSKGMDAKRLKESFGNSITFHGTIEKLISSKTTDELVAEVKNNIDCFGTDGGYILAPSNHIMDTEPEKIVLMYEVACEYSSQK
jgi:uroporphyrinogen decarboxylase